MADIAIILSLVVVNAFARTAYLYRTRGRQRSYREGVIQ